jgi:hypothetical protein
VQNIAQTTTTINRFTISQAVARHDALAVLGTNRRILIGDLDFLHIVAMHGHISAEGRARLDKLAGGPG